MNKLLTIKEEATRLRVKVSWLYRQTMQTGPGTIPRLKIGKYLRFDHEAVMQWIRDSQARAERGN